jgi:processive 1,2-diacylglycerol beta-glucosyltransferase
VARALILTGSLGAGHDASAARLSEELVALGWQVRVLDAMALLGGRSAAAGEAVFRRLINSGGGGYDALHFAHLRTGSRLALALDRSAVARLLPALRRTLGPDDRLVLSTFPTGAAAAARLAAERPQLRTVVLCTDPVVHRLWVHPGTDLFLVTSPAAAAWVRRFRPDARIEVIPFPLAAQFTAPPDRDSARRELGLPGSARCVLLLGGGWGIGPIEELAALLAGRGVDVLAVAGRNRPLAARLARLADRQARVHAFGFTDRMATLMSAADLVVSAPGAASCAEARAVGRPLVLLDVLPGHGRETIDHELGRGGAAVAGAGPAGAARVIEAALHHPIRAESAAGATDWPERFRAAMAGLGIVVENEGH